MAFHPPSNHFNSCSLRIACWETFVVLLLVCSSRNSLEEAVMLTMTVLISFLPGNERGRRGGLDALLSR